MDTERVLSNGSPLQRFSPRITVMGTAAMRVSPVGWLFKDVETALEIGKIVTEVSHSHPEGIKGAQAVILAICLARSGESGQTIRRQVADRFGYDMDRNVDHCRTHHQYNETCQHCVPEAIICALEAQSYEDAIRNAISLGGDADTLALSQVESLKLYLGYRRL